MSSGPQLENALGELASELFSSGPVASGAVAVELALTATELAAGAVKRIEIAHPNECAVCEARMCPTCEGRGVIEQHQGLFVIQRVCDCAGGRLYERGCLACGGTGATSDVVEVTIPPGSEVGQVIAVTGEGDLAGGRRGDLLVHLAVAGVDVPRAAIHQRGPSHVLKFAAIFALVLGAAALLSQIW